MSRVQWLIQMARLQAKCELPLKTGFKRFTSNNNGNVYSWSLLYLSSIMNVITVNRISYNLTGSQEINVLII